MRPDIFRADFSKMKYEPMFFKLKDGNRVVISGLTSDASR